MPTTRPLRRAAPRAAVFCTLLAGLFASLVATTSHALPTPVSVREGAVVAGGASRLNLPLLQPDGSVLDQTWNVWVGSFDIDVAPTDNGPWTTELAFCVDPWNWSVNRVAPYLASNLGDYAAALSASLDDRQIARHKAEIEALYSNFYAGTLGNAARSAAFQLALWEIVSDNGVGRVSNTDSTIWNDGQALLTQLAGSHFSAGAGRYRITTLTVDRSQPGWAVAGQNYLVAEAAPEPGSFALLVLALGSAAGALAHRRRRR